VFFSSTAFLYILRGRGNKKGRLRKYLYGCVQKGWGRGSFLLLSSYTPFKIVAEGATRRAD
jgi:hypothetical protein